MVFSFNLLKINWLSFILFKEYTYQTYNNAKHITMFYTVLYCSFYLSMLTQIIF
ncbi:Uncharacterised protein [Escherichia coli]|nr:Uncharacterised protein [Escherichia coli]